MTPLRYAGRILGTFGTEGHVLMGDCIAHFQGFAPGTSILIGYSPQFARSYTVDNCIKHSSRRYILVLRELHSADAALQLKEMGVFAEEEVLRVAIATQFFDDEIIDAEVIDYATGASLGRIIEIWETPAHEVWVVSYQGKELPIPAVDALIRSVDTTHKRVYINLIPGLLNIAHSTSK
ncbi:MAG: ribosome maturation factor RimM [Bacteroidota bacterium]|nr:ribosome maturation factor RimM [Candidatus Kapabacteria bacterium]MDW8219660.1 ribosome maturation factor RimM [Bacteroidota bacterium]